MAQAAVLVDLCVSAEVVEGLEAAVADVSSEVEGSEAAVVDVSAAAVVVVSVVQGVGERKSRSTMREILETCLRMKGLCGSTLFVFWACVCVCVCVD